MLNDTYLLYSLLLFGCVLLTFISYFAFEYDLLAPALAFNGGMTISVLLAFLTINKWGLFLHSNTVIVVLTTLLVMTISSYITQLMFDKVKTADFKMRYYPVVYLKLILSLLIMGIMIYLNFEEMYQLSLSLGNTKGITGIISTIRPFIEKEAVHVSRWMNYRNLIAQFIACFYLYIFSSNIIFYKKRWRNICLLLPVLSYLPFIILTTGRITMLTFLIFSLIVLGTLFQKKYGYTIQSMYKLFVSICMCMFVFMASFFILGEFTGKNLSASRTPFVIISHYAGLSIPAFDFFLNTDVVDTNLIGQSTLIGPYRNLNALGFNFPLPRIFLDFVKMDNIDTNVYTAMMRYINDYGFVGMYALVSLLAVGYSSLYYYIKKVDHRPIILIFYAMNAFPLYLLSIDDRFFIDIVNTQFLYGLVLLFICNRIYLHDFNETGRENT